MSERPGGGYWGLKAIVDSNRQLQRELDSQGIPGTGGLWSCPFDGSPLEYNSIKKLWNCPMGNYTTAGYQGGPR